MHARGETPASLARKHPELNKSTIGRWANGETDAPDPEKLRILASLLAVPYIDLMMAAGYVSPADLGRSKAPEPPEPTKHDLMRAIRDDDTLLPEAKAHLRNQYRLLLRVMPAHPEEQRRRKNDVDDLRQDARAEARARSESRRQRRQLRDLSNEDQTVNGGE